MSFYPNIFLLQYREQKCLVCNDPYSSILARRIQSRRDQWNRQRWGKNPVPFKVLVLSNDKTDAVFHQFLFILVNFRFTQFGLNLIHLTNRLVFLVKDQRIGGPTGVSGRRQSGNLPGVQAIENRPQRFGKFLFINL